MKKSIVILLTALSVAFAVSASEDHDHDREHEHGNEEKHDDHTEHDDHEGVSGEFKLSDKAIANFELKMQSLSGKAPWVLPKTAVMYSGEEVNIYRLRAGSFKRIDFVQKSKNGNQITIESKDLAVGDQVVIAGVGFLRIAELSAFGGTPEGHSH